MVKFRAGGRWRFQYRLRTILIAMVFVGPVVLASGPVSQWIGSRFGEDERSDMMQAPNVTLFNGDVAAFGSGR